MLVPIHIVALRRLRCLAGCALLVLLAATPARAHNPPPAIRIPLDAIGFQTLTPEFLAAGSSMLTLDLIDDQHLLITFNARTLLKRIPNDPPTDQDRNVTALLLELPSGRILARTQWRFHDRARYLWNLGHGRFLLRVRDTLTTFAPLANLATGDAFRQRPFLNAVDREIGVLFLTSDADLLTVETKVPTAPAPAPKTPLFGPTPQPVADTSPSFSQSTDPDPVQINFYRISIPDSPGDEVFAISAGAGRSRTFGNLDLTTAGYLDILDQGRRSWAFNFDTFTGKIKELAAFDSTCRPQPRFVSHSEFIAFGCHDAQNPQVLGAFNMGGEEMWEQGLYGNFFAPYLVYAPSSGRFALGRVMLDSPFTGADAVNPDEMTGQNVVVYQTDSGKQILKVECSPIERAGQNFALSPSGLSFAVVNDGAIEIYKLPALTAKEQGAVKLDEASAPEETQVPVNLAGETPSPSTADTTPAQPPASANATKAASASPANPPAGTRPNPPAPTTTGAAPAENASGDAAPEQPRKPPTLYTLPTDSPQNQTNDQPK